MTATVPTLAAWQDFYEIAGSSAGALIGLQFVVLSLIANMPHVRVDAQTGGTFSTPTIIHFSAVLALAMGLAAPWGSGGGAQIYCAAVGLAGAAYAGLVAVRLHRQTAYRPQFEDWLFHAIVPIAAFLGLLLSALAARWHPQGAWFGVGAAVLALLLTGIHNAWDAVVYHLATRTRA